MAKREDHSIGMDGAEFGADGSLVTYHHRAIGRVHRLGPPKTRSHRAELFQPHFFDLNHITFPTRREAARAVVHAHLRLRRTA